MDQLREWQSFREWKSGLVKQNFDKVKSEKNSDSFTALCE